ncbi:MAG: cofactor-independent phosphoglycerate mutase [Candidatus Omnitrophica bacterium]|jgi:2,3-bisphosphoglycerate-independent phosphoglycerate mutase|nr:MAG: 2,3-bisphosphoglycerate-independent phosphoglycerate mutase [Candidatus Hinthialibacteria bacterium OLB16]MBK7495470.1 cofactor-independent phosphoglycerate mutase [Candidatus Omnitrophota bacterium]MCK6496861.1 cofactor-independent phosphoglycerate mutase [bacterium]MCC6733333.1 cofactor-independent phosphoglycerate mutase [Candidatus Omnitrophota bacterium]MCL4736453.1 cofactor-independent phosphoglycerate mutase [Candidatus Omnitrophota bacterium]
MDRHKFIVILGDGMADFPIQRLGGKTPLQAAVKPHIDRIAAQGRCGLFHSIEPDLPTGSEIANLIVLGYDPHDCFQGRGVLEAASMGVDIGESQIGMRCNLICVQDGLIKNHSAGHISSEESALLLDSLNQAVKDPRYRFHTGVSYRHLFVGEGLCPGLECFPPHDHPNEPVADLMIRPASTGAASNGSAARETSDLLNQFTRMSWDLFKDHPVNQQRIANGKDPATSIWLWSPGRRPSMKTFQERFGVNGAVISAVDLIRGIGVYAGLNKILVPGATGLYDTNYEGKAQASLDALKEVDFVYVHVEAPDEAGHEGDLELKVRTIEDLDQRLVKPILEGLDRAGIHATVAILPDHLTPVETRTHARGAVPFAIWNRVSPNADSVQQFDEDSCSQGGYPELHGDEFIRGVLGRL